MRKCVSYLYDLTAIRTRTATLGLASSHSSQLLVLWGLAGVLKSFQLLVLWGLASTQSFQLLVLQGLARIQSHQRLVLQGLASARNLSFGTPGTR